MANRLHSPLAAAWRGKGIGPKQLADEMGLSLTHIYDLAAGRRRPSTKVLAELCSFFDMRPDELFPDLFGGRRESA